MRKARDDFNRLTKEKLAKRVSFHCSNPGCHRVTSGPGSEPTGTISIGVAAHICGAASGPGSKRFDPLMTSSERKEISNGIWLCQSCSRLIDTDVKRYPVTLLHQWKIESEHRIRCQMENPLYISTPVNSLPSLSKFWIGYTGSGDLPKLRMILTAAVDQLLHSGHATMEALRLDLQSKGFSLRPLELFLGEYIVLAPFIVDKATKEVKLDAQYETFYSLAKSYLISTEKKVLFIKSHYAQSWLASRESFNKLSNALGTHQNPHVLYRAIQLCPTAALTFLTWEQRGSTPVTGSSGLAEKLCASIQDDFLQYPDLLLEPDLLDSLYESGYIPKRQWEASRIHQMVEYQKGLSSGGLARLICNDSPEPEASKGKTATSIRLQFTQMTSDIHQNPIHLMAASMRICAPLEIRATDALRVELEIGDSNISEYADMEALKGFQINPTKSQGSRFTLPCSIHRRGHKLILQPHWNAGHDYALWKSSVLIHIEKQPSINSKVTTANCRIQFNLPWATVADVLLLKSDWQELLIIQSGGEATHVNLNNPYDQLIAPDEKMISRDLLQILGRFENSLGRKLPYPVSPLPKAVRTLVDDISGSGDANELLTKISMLDHDNIPAVSSFHCIFQYSDQIVESKYVGLRQGYRWPELPFSYSSSEISALINARLEKGSEPMMIRIPSSRIAGDLFQDICAAIECGNWLTPIEDQIRRFQPDNPFESRTSIEFHYDPEEDHIWYRLTPFRLIIKHLGHERWQIESHHFAENGDYRRAYQAAKEAWRFNPGSKTVSLAWWAFKSGLPDLAIKLSEGNDALDTKETILNEANLGLYHLVRASRNPLHRGGVETGLAHYRKALELYSGMSTSGCRELMEDIIADLLEYSQELGNHTTFLTKAFQLSLQGEWDSDQTTL